MSGGEACFLRESALPYLVLLQAHHACAGIKFRTQVGEAASRLRAGAVWIVEGIAKLDGFRLLLGGRCARGCT